MRISGSIILASVLAVAAIAWIASGQMGDAPATASQEPPQAEQPQTPAITRVRVRDLTSSPFIASVVS
ncbi:MAG: hypothetical protein P1U88_23355, partial [Thalassobaculaceae bacterium]|nr:hypothetical protein [Thalassobaculaceae bacterium]